MVIDKITIIYKRPYKRLIYGQKKKSEKYRNKLFESGISFEDQELDHKYYKVDYAEKVEVLKKTNKFLNITDNGKIIKGEWYKVKGKSESNKIITGYVFSSFLTKPKQKDIFEFINYDDNFDYSLLNTKKGDTLYSFINDNNDDRSYLRGDSIEIEWKEDLIYIAGDGDTKEIDDWIISTKKVLHKITTYRSQTEN